MTLSKKLCRDASAICMCALLAACATTQPVAYTALDSAHYMQPNLSNESGRIPYATTSQVDWKTYSALMMDSVAIYNGADNQFHDLSEADKKELADYMYQTFGETLAKRFTITPVADAHTLRIKLTLTGVETNIPVISTLAGGPYNLVQSARGKEGLMIGSASYAVEIYDAPTNQLLKAFVTKQYPNAMNIPATFGSLGAAKFSIDRGAKDLVNSLN